MGPWTGIRRRWKAVALVAVGAAGGGAALAVASVPSGNGVIHGCYLTTTSGGTPVTYPNLRVIDPSAGQSCNTVPNSDGIGEASVSWNQIGPRGPAGRSVTVAAGNTLTFTRGTVLTVGSSKGVTVTSPPLTRRSKPVGTVKLDLGRSSLTFPLFSWSLPAASSSGGGGGAKKVQVHEFVITKTHDASSARLAQFCASGKHFANVTIALRKAGGQNGSSGKPYLVIKLQTVLVSSYEASSGSDRPTESVSLNFTKIHFEYKNQ